VNNYFVKVFSQSVPIAKNPATTNIRVGLNIVETIVTDSDDATLLDPALGTSNELAPGAHRYKMSLSLTGYSLSAIPTNDFIELTRIIDGVQIEVEQTSTYNEVLKTIARRSYDTNGNFIVKPVSFKVRPWLRLETNNGIYTQDNVLIQFPDQTKVTESIDYAKTCVGVELDANKAYVNGFECPIGNNTNVRLNRARSIKYSVGNSLFNVGNYFYVASMYGSPQVDVGTLIELRDAPVTVVGTPAGNIIGYARVRNIAFHSGTSPNTLADAIFKLFVYDINLNSGKTQGDIGSFNVSASSTQCCGKVLQSYYMINNTGNFTTSEIVTGSIGSTSSVVVFKWDSANKRLFAYKNSTNGPLTDGDSVVGGTSLVRSIVSLRTIVNKNESASLLVKMPSNWVNTIKNSSNVSTTSYTILKKIVINLDSNGDGSNAGTSGEILAPISSTSYFGYVSAGAQIGTILDCASVLSGAGTISLAVNTSLAAGHTVTIFAPYIKTANVGTKLLTTAADLNVAVPGARIPLGVQDVYDISHIYDSQATGTAATTSDPDIKSSYRLVQNQNSLEYGGSYLEFIPGKKKARGQVKIQYRYFTRTGEIYTVDSYANIGGEYQAAIPSFTEGSNKIDVRDTIDSRADTYTDFNFYLGTITGSTTLTLIGDTSDLINVGATTGLVVGPGIPWGTYITAKNGTTLTLSGACTNASSIIVAIGIRVASGAATSSIAKNQIQTNTLLTYDYSYFLPRYDSLYITDESIVRVVEGQPADIPTLPEDVSDASNMKIADVFLPAFTADAELDKVIITPQEHKRYTMADITKLEKRIANVEVAVTQNMLEASVKDTQIVDANTGLNRFKSGFFADSFTTTDSADLGNNEYRATLDIDAGEVRPIFNHKSVGMSVNTYSPLVQWGDSYFIPYTEVVAVDQGLASRPVNVNGNSVFIWAGSMEISPTRDSEVDTITLPLVTTLRN
jgi:hypothetical protein